MIPISILIKELNDSLIKSADLFRSSLERVFEGNVFISLLKNEIEAVRGRGLYGSPRGPSPTERLKEASNIMGDDSNRPPTDLAYKNEFTTDHFKGFSAKKIAPSFSFSFKLKRIKLEIHL